MKIIIHRVSGVDPKFEAQVSNILTQIYETVRPPTAGIADVYLFSSSNEMKIFLDREAQSAGVERGFAEVEFSSYHWAWGGWPCIAVCADVCNNKDKAVWKGEIEHESAHSILHGELAYYSFLPPLTFANILKSNAFDDKLRGLLFYYLTVAIKDYEVTRLLVKHGILENQTQMHWFHLQPSHEEKTIWKELQERRNPKVEIIATINDLKILASSLPLLEHEPCIGDAVNCFLSIVTPRARKLLGSLLSSFETLGNDTHDNVETIAKTVGKLIQDII
ncbi:MAG: hypothetical protein ACFFCW_17050 [Candidatus Hodarchaeota archaeon]